MFSKGSSSLSLRALLIVPLLLLAGQSAGIAAAATAQKDSSNSITVPAALADKYVPGSVIVKIESGAGGKAALALLTTTGQALGLSKIRELVPGTGEYLLTGASSVDVPAAVARFAALPGVRYANPNAILQANRVPSDKLYADHQWYLRTVQAEAAWDITTGDGSIIIAGLDTGVDADHPDLAGKLLPGYNTIQNNGNFQDDNGHGTMTSGLFGAESNNGEGIAGLCWACKILPIKFLNSGGGGNLAGFATGIHWAVDNGARIINISAGNDEPLPSMEEAVNYARSKNVVIIASAGNTPDGKPRYPAGYPSVIAVGATSNNNTTTGFSSYGPYVDISAPGVGILSTAWRGTGESYDFANGTSFSAPLVAGAAGLILSLNPSLNPEQVQAVLESSATDIERSGWDDLSGWGELNVAKALQIVQSGNIPALPQVPATPTPNTGAPATPTSPATIGGSSIRGKVTGVDPANAQVSLIPERADIVPRTTRVGADGSYSFDNLAQGRYSIGLLLSGGINPPAPQQVEVDGQGATVREVNFNVGGAVVQPTQPTTGGTPVSPTGPRPSAFDAVAAPGGSFAGQYFAAVGHTLSGSFQIYWQQNGGLAIFGYPLSEPFQEISATDGKPYTVQYFERNRFELHPENAMPNDVLLGLLGRTVSAGRNFPAGTSIAEDANHRFFTATQHSLSDAFLHYWQQHGGLAIFGYPISEPMMETSATDGKPYMVQYFERNRFELHPENPAPNDVLLGLLGVEVLKARGWR